MLTLDTYEWDGVTSRRPVDDAAAGHPPFPAPNEPTMPMIGRSYGLQFYTCVAFPAHRHVTNMQSRLRGLVRFLA